MKNIVGVRFKKPGKIYFFDPDEQELKIGDQVIVETAIGKNLGEVVVSSRKMPEEKIKTPLKKIIRKATKEDIKHQEDNQKKEKEAFNVCQKKIKEHKLKMNLVDAEYTFDNTKILFYFTADGRIDFRELVRDLAAIFKTRIELRQIGVRDEVRRIGGNGVCGRELCCCSFLNNFDTVSIKMAKEQNISLNPSKISGNCGRLMCCLKYEQDVYEEKTKRIPKPGAIVKTEDGQGVVDSVEILKEIINVRLKDEENNNFYKKYKADDVKLIRNPGNEKMDEEEKEHQKELEELEKLEKMEESTKGNYDDMQ